MDIRFRAWDTRNSLMIDRVIEHHNASDILQKDDRYVPMQYVGLKDANGVEIYEGDVYFGVNDPYKELSVADMHKTIAWHYNDIWEHSGLGAGEWEVIGNVHENPELLDDVWDDC